MPIRLRLALWNGLLTALLVLVVGIPATMAHERSAHSALDRALRGAAEHVAAAHEAAHDPTTMLAMPLQAGISVRVYATDGTLLAETPNATLAPRLDPLPAITAGQGEFHERLTADRTHWRFYQLQAVDESESYVAEASLAELHAEMRTLERLLPLLALGGGLLTFATGALLAGRALQPVGAMTQAARAIARAREPKRRVSVPVRRDELGTLALTFNEMLDSLDEAAEQQRRFIADASHELRAPLTAIQANLALLARPLAEAERHEVVAEARAASERLSRLAGDLLALAHADAGVTLARQPVEWERPVLDAWREAERRATGQRLALGPFAAAMVQGDAERLRQLALILLDNALRYTPAGGAVTLSLTRQGDRAVLTIADTGIGIAPDAQSHLFERFYRSEAARAHAPSGAGLGLAIARWITEQHGGTITVDGTEGAGTTVRVCLPLATA